MKLKPFIVFISVLIPALIITLSIQRHFGIKRYYRGGDQLMKEWSSQAFIPINDKNDFSDAIRAIQIKNSIILDDQMTESLRSAVLSLFMAYNSGTFDSYQAFHMPTGKGHYDPKLLQRRILDILAAGSEPVTSNLQEGGEIFADYWEKIGAKKYTGFFQGLCTNQCDLVVSVTNTSSGIEDLFNINRYIQISNQLGITDIKYPTYVSDPQPSSVVKKYGNIYQAELKALVKNSDGTAYPIFCLWYFSPDDKKWIPFTIGTEYMGSVKRKTYLEF